MAGLRPEGVTDAPFYDTYERNLSYAADEVAKPGRKIVIEPVKTRDLPGFFKAPSWRAQSDRGDC